MQKLEKSNSYVQFLMKNSEFKTLISFPYSGATKIHVWFFTCCIDMKMPELQNLSLDSPISNKLTELE